MVAVATLPPLPPLATVEAIEAWWLAITGAGALLTFLALMSAVRDERELRRDGRNGLLRIAGRGSSLEAACLLACELMLAAVGAIAGTLPAPPPHPMTAFELAFDFLMFGAASCIALAALVGRVKRRRMLAYADAHPEG